MIRTAITRRISTAIVALGLAIFGALNIGLLPVDFLPSVKYPLIKLSIVWPGATPEDIDRNLADPIERQVASVDGLNYLTSSALEGLYQLDVNYRYGVDVDVAYQDTLAAFARSQKDLPPDIDPPVIIKADPSQLPIVQVAFESDRMDLTQLRTWVDNWLTDPLLAAGGVAAVDVAGGLEREIRILVDGGKLEKHGLSLELVERRLREENVQRLGGRVEGIMANTRAAAKVLVIDGCQQECARKTMKLAGFSGFAHLQLERDFHFNKGATRVTSARIRQIADRGADLLAS